MILKDLDARGTALDIVLLQTPSTKLQMFILDKLKSKFQVNNDTYYTVESKSDLKEVRNLMGVNTPYGGSWFVFIDLDKFHEMKDIFKVVNESTTCVFLIFCSKYSMYKAVKEGVSKSKVLIDLYITYLRRADLVYLYDCLVPKENTLTSALFNYVAKGYGGDIDAIFELFIALNSGKEVTKKNDIIKICGLGGNTVDSFIFSLLSPISGSDKGVKKVIKNRLLAGLDLIDNYGIKTLYNYIKKSVFCMIEVKQLVMSGVVYKSIRNLPDRYDEKSLVRYNRHIWRIKEIPMSDLLRLQNCLSEKVWTSDLDMVRFIYKLYKVKVLLKLDERIG